MAAVFTPPLSRAATVCVSDRILRAVEARDRIIEGQAQVLRLVNDVLRETSVQEAVRKIVKATYDVVDCDRVSLFLVEEEGLVCRAAPKGGAVGWRLEPGQGIAGSVAETGEAVNIPDAYQRLDLFDPSNDQKHNYQTKSVLCLPLKEQNGEVIGVLQAINKISRKAFVDEFIAFDNTDETMLRLLLALCAQQLALCRLNEEKESAMRRADTTLRLVETICSQNDLQGAYEQLASATWSFVDCQYAFVFALDHNLLQCRGAASILGRSAAAMAKQLQLNVADIAALERTLSSREALILGKKEHPSDIAAIAQKLVLPLFSREGDATCNVLSALCVPMFDSNSAVFALIVAVNKRYSPADANNLGCDSRSSSKPSWSSSKQAPHPSSSLRSVLKHGTIGFEVCDFEDRDLEKLQILFRLVTYFIKTSSLYDQQLRTSMRLSALLALIEGTQYVRGQTDKAQKVNRLVEQILKHSCDIFECDRCTFFAVDNLNNELVGHYAIDGKIVQMRVPFKGIVGEVDLKTGYRTETILCAPMIASNGKLLAVLQCINKRRHERFGPQDERDLVTLSSLLSGALQSAFLESTYETFIQPHDTINADVRDALVQYFNTTDAIVEHERPAGFFRMVSPGEDDVSQSISDLKRWDFDHMSLSEDYPQCIRACLAHSGFMDEFRISENALAAFVQTLKARYSTKNTYHTWAHAFGTFHAQFLLMRCEPLRDVISAHDKLGLLLAALGHDVEHPGFNNAFLVASRHELALRYNDMSVLENHHAALTCKYLEHPVELGTPKVLDNVEPSVVQHIRKIIITSILHTDMAKHQDIISWLESCNLDLLRLSSERQLLAGEDALGLARALLHCADLVHPVLPWKMHKRMSLLCQAEFYSQSQQEIRLGMPTLPFMSKDPQAVLEIAPVQVGFVQFAVAPLWSAMNFVAGGSLSFAMQNLEHNKSLWKALADGKEVEDEQPFEQGVISGVGS
eukprot:TRINITY_DN18376_c0_g1_i2.p1 TRINITY_DN18376_c0_g1~~TRINITY_DN18376_c0_g1_i2.p1  ORF type:complete len:972 (-),score=161.67 TRINITY_DN18376_c0_g1_i2:21-2936(-)